MDFQTIIDKENPCPTVNPYVVAEYRYLRKHSNTLASACFSEARSRFEAGALASAMRQYADLSLFSRDAVCGKRFEAHGYNCRFVEKASAVGLSDVGYCDTLANIGHTGWYSDVYEVSTLRGVVFYVVGTSPSGEIENVDGAYLIGYEGSENPGTYLIEDRPYWRDQQNCGEFTFMRDLARAADRFAQRFAEEEREYSHAWAKAHQAHDEAAEARSAVRELTAAMRTLRGRKKRSRKEMCRLRLEIGEAIDDYKDKMKALAEALSDAKPYGITLADVS